MKINLIILFLIFTSFLKAEEPFWEYIGGPNGGNCQNLVYNEITKIFYLTTTNGIFRSTDDGLNWERIYYNKETKKNIINKNGSFLEVLNSNDVYYYNSINNEKKKVNGLKLRNAFSQWLYLSIDSSDNCFIIDQIDQNDDIVNLYFINPIKNISDSTRIRRQDLDTAKNLKYFINDPKIQDGVLSITILAYSSQVQFSIIMKFDQQLNILSKIYAPRVWNIEYEGDKIIGTIVNNNQTYLSRDNGINWEIIFNKTGTFAKSKNNLYFFSYIWDVNSVTFDSIYVSSDFGLTWKTIGYNDKIMNGILINNNNKIYAFNERSVYTINNEYNKWIRKDSNLKSAVVNSIFYSRNGELYASSYGVHKSSDNGKTWIFLGLDDQRLDHILVADNGFIFTAGDLSSINRGNIFRSKDDGKTWEWLNNLYESNTYLITDLYQNKRGHIFAGVNGLGGYFYSTDYGDSWNYKSTEGVTNCFSRNSEGHIFSGYYAGIVFRSTDDGDTWEQMTQHFSGDNCFWDITSIAFDPKGGNGYSFCLKTSDNGRTWIQNSETPPDYSFCFDSLGNYFRFRRETNAVYQVYRSTNKGLDWVNISSGIVHNNYNILSVSPDGYYFLGAENGGIYRSKQKYVSVEENQQKTETIVYPNPTNNLLYLKLEGESQIFIYNLLGQLELNIMESDNQYVDVSALDEGMYIIKIKSGLNIKTEKFIINR